MDKPNHNFCDLKPEAQRLLYRKIIQFDLAANLLATSRNCLITATRADLLIQVHLFLKDNSINHQTISIFLKQLATENNIDKDSFHILTPESMWAAWTWVKAADFALGDRVLKFRQNKHFPQLRHENLKQASTVLEGMTTEEITIYWAGIDSWEPQDREEFPLLAEVA